MKNRCCLLVPGTGFAVRLVSVELLLFVVCCLLVVVCCLFVVCCLLLLLVVVAAACCCCLLFALALPSISLYRFLANETPFEFTAL